MNDESSTRAEHERSTLQSLRTILRRLFWVLLIALVVLRLLRWFRLAWLLVGVFAVFLVVGAVLMLSRAGVAMQGPARTPPEPGHDDATPPEA